MRKLFALLLLCFTLGCSPAYLSMPQITENLAALGVDNADYQKYALEYSKVAYVNETFLNTIMAYAMGIGGDKTVAQADKDAIVKGAEYSDYAKYLLDKASVASAEGDLKLAADYVAKAKKALFAGVEIASPVFNRLNEKWSKKSSF